MSRWNILYREEAIEDIEALDGSIRPQVMKMIRRVAENPLPQREGGYGVELGNKNGVDLTGCLKIKLKKAGIRVIYTLERSGQDMTVVIVGMRADLEVYKETAKRLGK